MQILVTGGTGAFGRAVAARLGRSGADVVAMARHVPERLPPGVRFVSGDVGDPDSITRAMADCDVVVHLAWMMSSTDDPGATKRVNVGGSANVLRAMEHAGCGRLVFASSVTAYGTAQNHPEPFREDEPLRPDPAFEYAHHKMEVEDLISASEVDAVMVRTAATLGRGVENSVAQQFAAPVIPAVRGDTNLWQLVHQEDVGRFIAEAALATRTGIVNLAADDVLTPEEMGELLERPTPRLPLAMARAMVSAMARVGVTDMDPAAYDGLRYMPVADTTRLRDEWRFRCAWSSADTARDAARSLTRATYIGNIRIPRRRRLPWVEPPPHDWPRLDDGPLLPAAPEGVAGEFDDVVHPDHDTFTATNLSEAFPGPLTPMSVTVSIDALRAGQSYMVDFLGMSGEIAHESRVRMVAVFGHNVYLNVSLARASTEGLPGITPEDMDAQYLGIPLPEGFERPRPTVREVVGALATAGRIVPPVVGLKAEGGRLATRAAALVLEESALVRLDDAALEARAGLLRDELAQCWAAVITVNPTAGAAVSAVERSKGTEGVAALRVGDGGLASGAAIAGVEALAARVRRDPVLSEAFGDGTAVDLVGRLGELDAEFARAFDDLLRDVGHRGPGELELANPVFADRPEQLLDAVLKAAGAPDSGRSAPVVSKRGLLERVALSLLATREDIRDTTVRVTHQLRLTVREQGRRLEEAGVLDSADDVFYLAADELFAAPPDTKSVIVRRRAERERLAKVAMPTAFTGTWHDAPSSAATGSADGDESEDSGGIVGIAAAPGVARGPVRLVESGDQLEPGDVLVARVTDTGWTPFFAFAAAVVTDVGGLMSHPAVVAREYGIPCVVGTNYATRRLVDGDFVEVDGDAGTVRIVEDDGSVVEGD